MTKGLVWPDLLLLMKSLTNSTKRGKLLTVAAINCSVSRSSFDVCIMSKFHIFSTMAASPNFDVRIIGCNAREYLSKWARTGLIDKLDIARLEFNELPPNLMSLYSTALFSILVMFFPPEGKRSTIYCSILLASSTSSMNVSTGRSSCVFFTIYLTKGRMRKWAENSGKAGHSFFILRTVIWRLPSLLPL